MQRFTILITLVVLLGASILISTGCRKDIIIDDPVTLEFSADTVLFDTVFTTIGSVTLPLKVYNPEKGTVRISSILLAGQNNSNFRMNVDGVAADHVEDVEIEAGDSIYIFIEVTVDPNSQNTPLIITDSIIFLTNGNEQDVDLVAWGQDAYFHYPTNFSPNLPPYSLVGGNWGNDKPHVIYGYAVVDEDSVLTIEKGTQVHLHNSSVLWVYDGGTLKVEGRKDEPVVFQGDRLEEAYKDTPGQWGRIWLSAGSIDNKIDYAIIRNGSIGLHVDTLGASSNPTLRLSNTIIENMTVAGLYAQGSWVEAYNTVITNCGSYALVLAIGGDYDFKHCTIGNYWNYGVRQTPSLALNNYYEDINDVIQIRDLNKAYFGNCIIHGSNAEEILLDSASSGGIFNYRFENCIVQTERDISTLSPFASSLSGVNESNLFMDRFNNDLHLKDQSPAIDFGNATITGSLNPDLDEVDRLIDSSPDAGAYEYVPPAPMR